MRTPVFLFPCLGVILIAANVSGYYDSNNSTNSTAPLPEEREEIEPLDDCPTLVTKRAMAMLRKLDPSSQGLVTLTVTRQEGCSRSGPGSLTLTGLEGDRKYRVEMGHHPACGGVKPNSSIPLTTTPVRGNVANAEVTLSVTSLENVRNKEVTVLEEGGHVVACGRAIVL